MRYHRKRDRWTEIERKKEGACPKCHFTYIFLLFLFCSGAPLMTLLTGGARQLQACARLMHGWVASAGCPQTKILDTPVMDTHIRMDTCTHGHMHAWTHERTDIHTDTHTRFVCTHMAKTRPDTHARTHTRIRTLRIHTRGTHMHPYTYAHTHTHTRAVLRLVWPFDGLYKTKFNWITWSPPKYFLPIIFS